MIMIDRSCDLVSPFCRQHTYEGLLDDYFGIDCTHCTLKTDIAYPCIEPEDRAKMKDEVTERLTSSEDNLFH